MKCRTKLRLSSYARNIIEKAKEWDRKYLEVTVHAIDLYAPERHAKWFKLLLSRRNAREGSVVNPYTKSLWVADLLGAYVRRSNIQSGADNNCVHAMITLIHEEWAFADSSIKFDLSAAKKKVRNALAGTDYIGCFEAGLYKNEKYITDGKEGRLISFHFHALISSSSKSKLDRLCRRMRERFTPILRKKSGVHKSMRQTVEERADTLLYLAKMPFLGYRTIQNGSGNTVQRSTSKLSYESRWLLFQAMRNYRTPDLWLAGGSEVSTLREARVMLNKRRGIRRTRD